jgi:hypothetical protein
MFACKCKGREEEFRFELWARGSFEDAGDGEEAGRLVEAAHVPADIRYKPFAIRLGLKFFMKIEFFYSVSAEII